MRPAARHAGSRAPRARPRHLAGDDRACRAVDGRGADQGLRRSRRRRRTAGGWSKRCNCRDCRVSRCATSWTSSVSLYPSGTTTFTDVEALTGGRSYSLWDFMSEINCRRALCHRRRRHVVHAAAAHDRPQDRAAVRSQALARPAASRDRGLLRGAMHERARGLARDARRRAQGAVVAAARRAWTDAAATWKDAQTLAIDYTPRGGEPIELSRRITDPTGRAHRRLIARHSAAPRPHANRRDGPPAPDETSRHRPIRSFVLRSGRMSPAQQRALETLWPNSASPSRPRRSTSTGCSAAARRACSTSDSAWARRPRRWRRRGRTSTFSLSTCTRPAWAASCGGSTTRRSPTCASSGTMPSRSWPR